MSEKEKLIAIRRILQSWYNYSSNSDDAAKGVILAIDAVAGEDEEGITNIPGGSAPIPMEGDK